MSSSTLSILGLYQYGIENNDDLFKNMNLPNGIDKELVKNTILEQCSEFEILYPDFSYLQFSIGLWSNRWNRTFTKWFNALKIMYNPLENYDRIESWEETDKGTAESGSNTDSVSDNFVTAYNSDELHQERRDKSEFNGKQTASSQNINNKSGRIHGNIGVTTSQQMLEAELDIAKFNLVQQIVDIFKQEYCILVY